MEDVYNLRPEWAAMPVGDGARVMVVLLRGRRAAVGVDRTAATGRGGALSLSALQRGRVGDLPEDVVHLAQLDEVVDLVGLDHPDGVFGVVPPVVRDAGRVDAFDFLAYDFVNRLEGVVFHQIHAVAVDEGGLRGDRDVDGPRDAGDFPVGWRHLSFLNRLEPHGRDVDDFDGDLLVVLAHLDGDRVAVAVYVVRRALRVKGLVRQSDEQLLVAVAHVAHHLRFAVAVFHHLSDVGERLRRRGARARRLGLGRREFLGRGAAGGLLDVEAAVAHGEAWT
ncbi:hypothetical protein M885DRAFT_543790 [Pelagophyceae sp. CCMP2097]|nr:hypothetical protein M885DRAFT_543790 [Pelagophyceae sp. CCMP2097]